MKLKVKLLTVLFLVVMTGLCFPQADGVKLEKSGEWKAFGYSHLAVQGDYAYCVRTYGGVDVFNISRKDNPEKIGHFDLNLYASSITLSGKYAFVVANPQYENSRVYILDVSNPTGIKIAGVYSNDFVRVSYLTVNGNYLYVAGHRWICGEDQGEFDVVDLSDLSNLKTTASFKGEVIDYGKFLFAGNYLYIPCILEKDLEEDLYLLRVYNISDPSSPTFIKQIDVVSDLNTFFPSYTAVSGNKIVWSRSGEMKLLDISDPIQPVVSGTTFNNEYRTILLSGKYFYLFNETNLEIVDGTDLNKPVILSSLKTRGANSFLFACESTGSLYCVADPEEIVESNGFDIFDVSKPSAPVKAGYVYEPGPSCTLYHTVVGKYAYLVDGSRGLHILDISNPASPVKTGLFVTDGMNAIRVAVSKSFAYMISSQRLEIIDVSDKANPVLTGSLSLGEISGPEIAISGDYAFIKNGDKILVVDASSKSSPKVIATYKKEAVIQSFGISGDYIYVGVSDTTDVVDITDKSNPVKITSIQGCGKITVSGNYLYILIPGNPQEIRVFDISNPVQPVLAGNYKSLYTIYGMTVSGNFAYLTLMVSDCWSDYTVVSVVDFSTPSSPRLIYWNSSMPAGTCMTSDGNNVYTSPLTVIFDARGAIGTPGLFSIMKSVASPKSWIELVSPNGGETLSQGGTYDIRFTTHNYSGTVSFTLLRGGCFEDTIAGTLVEPGVFRWEVPGLLPDGDNYRIMIKGADLMDLSDNYFSLKKTWPSCSLTLSRTNLNFAATAGKIPPTQEVGVNAICGTSFSWTAQGNVNWITVTPGSGDGSAAIRVGVNPSGLTEGTYTGKIVLTPAPIGISPKEITVTFKVLNKGAEPFGEFSTPLAGSTVNGSVPVTGWALDDIGVTSVKIYRDPVNGEGSNKIFIGDALLVEGARPDVEAAYPGYPDNNRAGWGYMLLTHFLPGGGNDTYTLYAIATDSEGNEKTLGTRVITSDNEHSELPFGAIDTPQPGETVSGSEYVNFGWTLTPPPNNVPLDGSSIIVWIDGVSVGNPTYGQYREDIANAFPGYLNIDGAGGYFDFNPRIYTNGLHTISWSVKDSAGNEQGIGSRYFTIRNKNQNPALETPSSTDTDTPLIQKSTQPISFKKGFGSTQTEETVYPDEKQGFSIEIKETDRLEINLLTEGNETGSFTGHLITGKELRDLPVGTTLDSINGTFSWQPGPGFIGKYTFEFREKGTDGCMKKKTVKINIIPRFN